MGLGLSLYTMYQVARICSPTVVESALGAGRREVHDQRLRSFAHNVVKRSRMQLSVHGAEQVPLDRAFVYMSNHQSHIDIPVLYATVPSPTLRMAAKVELFRIPLLGRAMRGADFIEIDRGNRQRAVDSLKRAASLIDSGVSVWIAPEGSRSPDGHLAPLKKGGFHLAMQTGTDIVPVAIDGTRAVLPPGVTRMRPGVSVEVTFGRPIATAGRTLSELMAAVEAFLAARLAEPARGP